MARLLDTSVLIAHWRHSVAREGPANEMLAIRWALGLQELHATWAIATPVVIEFIAGARNELEVRVVRTYVSQFKIADEGRILAQDWDVALALASHVPRDGKPRQLGDCLIRSIARRLHYDVFSLDLGFA